MKLYNLHTVCSSNYHDIQSIMHVVLLGCPYKLYMTVPGAYSQVLAHCSI